MWSNCSDDDAGLGCAAAGGGGGDGRNPARELESLEEERRLAPRFRQSSRLSNRATPERIVGRCFFRAHLILIHVE